MEGTVLSSGEDGVRWCTDHVLKLFENRVLLLGEGIREFCD